MLSTLKGIFGRSVPAEQKKGALAVVDEYDEEIPRYPPFAKGLPVAPIDKVVATQSELVERIRNALGFNREQHEELILPVIQRYAEFVHLLPASEAHHHRGAGGLFRHGLEVAFWAAQASEAVIFSMEGSPRERRNNEPRWRLASCFSGLLHDVGKPLSDVSVTDKDGSVTWNPYANTLYGWAAHHKIDRYFLRWRDNRHKRHEQFSLLTIERIIPPNVLQYLSEAGPEILEAMLEAIAGTSTNQPVTKLMLKADQESVARDLKQSRLDVDEFSYGVPVERYVFDAIRRLVKTGKWKVNEAGARVWHLHQGVFITWRQLGDLYELISKDKIPGIPRDPDTLADILIERGFAIPNKVPASNGESAHYRYWEVCPELLQEGRPAGSVKLLGLRLESHELVFTTEPPAPVKAVIVGEQEEPEIQFADIDDDADGEQSFSENTPPSENIDGDGGADEEQESGSQQSGLEDAYEVAASVPEIGADGASPLDGLMGGTDGTDFPFDAFGMDQPAQDTPSAPADTTPEQALTPVDSKEVPPLMDEVPGDVPDFNPEPPFMDEPPLMDAPSMDPNSMMGSLEPPTTTNKPAPAMEDMFSGSPDDALDISSLFPGKNSKGPGNRNDAKPGKKGSSDKPSQNNKAPQAKTAQQPSTPEKKAPEPKTKQQPEQAREKLDAALQGFPADAQQVLRKAIYPVLAGEKLLGEVLCMFQGQAAILYPEGAAALGNASEVLSCLWEAGAVAGDPVMPGKKIQTFKGMKGLVLTPNISSLVVDALNEAESSMEDIQDVLLAGVTGAGGRKDKKTPKAGKKKVTPKEQGEQKPVAKRAEKKVQAKKTKAESVQPKQNSTSVRRPEKPVSPAPSQPTPKLAKKEVSIPEIEENTLLPKGQGQMTADFDDIKPKTMTVEAAIAQLKEMIIKREGRWITSAVTKEGGFLVTSGKSLEVIAGEYADLSKHNLRAHLKRGQAEPPMMYKQGKLYLVLKENNEP